MERFNLFEFIELGKETQQLLDVLKSQSQVNAPIADEQRQQTKDYMAKVLGRPEHPWSHVSRVLVRRLAEALEDPTYTVKQLMLDLERYIDSSVIELGTKPCLVLEGTSLVYYDKPLHGWEQVIVGFPSAVLDIEEASKCFALNRYTAAVFHLMRIMEIGLRVLGETLDDPRINPKTNPNWERILQRCRDEQGKRLAERSPEWRDDEAFFSGVSARLMAVKDAWRNPTMHVQMIYTEETALDVFNHVKAFMRHLATKLHE